MKLAQISVYFVQENKIYSFIFILNTNQTNISISSNKIVAKFYLVKIFCNMIVWL